MSVVVIAAASAAVNARYWEREERYKAKEDIQICTGYWERAAAEARERLIWTADDDDDDDVRAVEQRASAAETKEKEARERVEYEARVKVERAATEARESAAAAARMNQQKKNEEMASAKSKNLLKRLLQCWNFCS